MTVHTIIVGAGLSGVTATRELQSQGLSYVLIEKAPVVGGRLSTVNLANGVADDGAQFFSARDDAFIEQVQTWQSDGLIFEMGTEWSDGSIKKTVPNAELRYAFHGGMVNMAQTIASDLRAVETGLAVQSIRFVNNIWYVTAANDRVFKGENLILTAPVPQSLALLSEVSLSTQTSQQLARIHYSPNLTAIFALDGETELPVSGGVQLADDDSILHWIVDNQVKGISDTSLITVQAKRIYSKDNFASDDETLLSEMRDALQPYLKPETKITASQLKRWQYSSPITTYPQSALQDETTGLVFAGDAFGGRGRIEGAYLSGLAAARITTNTAKIPESTN